ncbi:uncharacterized protein [Palaemon carinicauda]|uniref:uncharacterized protein n=1 Tax=Palaemon carinicauda TaxID=392227 RepID=UPI0035B6546D
MDGYLPKEHGQHNPSRKKTQSDLIWNGKNQNHSLTYGNELVFQSVQSDEATQPSINSYICSICKKLYVSDEQLKEHLVEHITYTFCKACGQSFSHAKSLRNHTDISCKKRRVMCKVCNNIFLGVEVLRKHCEVHFSDSKYICGFCGEKHGRYLCVKRQCRVKSKLKEVSLAGNSQRKGSTSPTILQEVIHNQGDFQSNVNSGPSRKLLSIRDPLIYNNTGNPKPMNGNVILVRGSSSVKVNAVVPSGKSSMPIAFSIPRDTWKGVSLREPSLTDGVDHVTITLERSSSNGFFSSTKIASPQTSREYSTNDRPPQNEMTEIGAFVEPGNRADNQRTFIEGPSLDMPFSTNAAIHPSFFECSSSTNLPQSMTDNHEAFLKGTSSNGFASVIETVYRRIHQEDLTQNRSPSQNQISEKDTSLTWVTLKPPSSVTEIDNRGVYLKGPTSETSFSTGCTDHPPFLAPSSLKSPSRSNNDNHEVLSEISPEGFSPSIAILNPKISHEDLSYARPSQNDIPEISSYPEHRNLRVPSSANEKDNHELCLGWTSAEKSQISINSIDDPWIPFAKDSESETLLPFEISPSLYEFPEKTFEEKNSSSDTDNSLQFSEINLPSYYVALGLPADMYDISSNFQNIEMNEMPNEIHEDNSGMTVNEGDNIFPQWIYAMKPEAGKELIDHEYGKEYDASEINGNLNFGNEDPEDYYLDDLDYLKGLYD